MGRTSARQFPVAIDAGSTCEEEVASMKRRSSHVSTAHRQQRLEQVDALLRNYGADAATPIALQALAEGVEHPTLLNLAGMARYDEGRFQEAIEFLKRARSLAPRDPHVLNSLGMCLLALGQPEAALQA